MERSKMVMVEVLILSLVDLGVASTTGAVTEARLPQVASEAGGAGDPWPRSKCLVTVGEAARDRDSAAVVEHSFVP